MKNLLNYTLEDLQIELVERGFSKFNAKQIFDWVYKKHNFEIESWSNISKKLREQLEQEFCITLPTIIWEGQSSDGTRKFLLRLEDEQSIETVLIPARDRLTQCISSQVGCAIGCNFCHTGTQGLKRHLTVAEVVGQFLAMTVWLKTNVHPDEKITNIVYMGQGSPWPI